MTTDHLTRSSSTTGSGTSSVRSTILAAGLALAAATDAVLLVVRPWGERDALEYADLSPVRDGMWTGVALDGISFAVIGLTLGLMVCALARSRGAAWATVGAVMTTLGGAVYAMGAYAFASLVWYATDTDVLAAADGTRLLDYAVDHPEHGQVLHMAGFLAYTLGTLAVAVALLRSSAIHRTVPIALIVLTVAQFTPIPGRALDFLQVALMVVLAAIAGSYLRSTR